MADEHTHADGKSCRSCATMKNHRRLLDTDRNYARRLARAEDHAFRAMQSGITMRSGCTRIPVVVHVVWNAPEENISQAQIDSQIAILNKDFRKKNADISNVPAAFAPLAGDARIEFVLASEDPDGNPTNGVTRTQTNETSFGSNDEIKSSSTGGADAWDTTEYLNIWVGRLSGGLLGYAQFPGGPADTDGVVCTYTAFGDTGTAAAPFDKGRTATHEIGHWLNLRHIWGDDGGGCNGTDHVADTPNQGGPNLGKPTFPSVSCNNGPNGDMFMNYMDYVDDDTMVMFTEGQIARMQACLDGPRSSIGESIPCVTLQPKSFPDDIGKPPKDLPKDIIKDIPKDRPKDLPKDVIKEGIKDPPKDFGKDFPKDVPKDLPKDLGKDGPKDGPKDPPKEFSKDGPKEGPKDPPKDFGKDGPKDPPKDFGKDGPKDGPKDPPKDVIKEGPFDPGPKGIKGDPPKTIFEGPGKTVLEGPDKGIFEGPFIPGGGLPKPPLQPIQPTAPIQPTVPFVLGTGAAPNANAAAPQADPNAGAALAHYAQILATYADLYQRGMLDEQGMMGWQQTYAAYVQMGGQ